MTTPYYHNENLAKAVVSDALPDSTQDRLDELQKELLQKVKGGSDYNATADKILRLKDRMKKFEIDSRSLDETKKRIAELQEFIGTQNVDITKFDEALVKRLIAKITVYADRFEVDFKSGMSVEMGNKGNRPLEMICFGWSAFLSLQTVSYRTPMTVKSICLLQNGTAFPVCSKCSSFIEREYVNCCEVCGQVLSWKGFYKEKVIQ